MRLAYSLALVAACGTPDPDLAPDAPSGSIDAPASAIDAPASEIDAPPTVAFIACSSQRGQTNDPDCPAAPSYVVFGASHRPGDSGPAHSLPAAFFPTPLQPWQWERPVVALDTCMPVTSVDEGSVPTAPTTYRDVGALAVTVDGTAVGGLVYAASTYGPTGELATRTSAIFDGGETIRVERGTDWGVEVVAPPVPEVTSFAHTIQTQIEPAFEDLALAWIASGGDDVVEIAVGTQYAFTYCAVRDDGAFAIPWPIFQEIFDAGGGELFVFVDRSRRTVVAETSAGPVQIVVRATDSQGFAFQR